MAIEVQRVKFATISNWLKKSIPNSLFVYNALITAEHGSTQMLKNFCCFVNCCEQPTMAITIYHQKNEPGCNFIEMLFYFDTTCESESKLKFIQSPSLIDAIKLMNAPIELWYLSEDHDIVCDGLSATFKNLEIQSFGGEDLDYVLAYLPCKPCDSPSLQPEFKIDSML